MIDKNGVAKAVTLSNYVETAAHYRVSVRTVKRWVQRGIIMPVRIGRTVRFDLRRDEKRTDN